MTMIPFGDHSPRLAPTAWIAPGVTLVGDVTLGPRAGVWYGSVVRADLERIEIGAGSNVQDGCVLHADPGRPAVLGAGVSVGHRAVVHGCTVEDGALVGMGAVLLNGCRIGAGSLVAAGAVVREDTEVPPGVLVAGVPARVRRALTPEESASLRGTAERYQELARRHSAHAGHVGSTARER